MSNVNSILAQKIGKTPEEIAPMALLLLAHTDPASEAFKERFGPLEGHIIPTEFEEFFIHFCRGIQYVHERYGTAMESYLIGNREDLRQLNADSDICYMDGTVAGDRKIDDTVVLAREFIGEWAWAKRAGTIGGTGHLSGLTMAETATALGVEEAYHAYQLKILHPELRQLSHEKEMQRLPQIRAQLEAELSPVLSQAARDLGFGNARMRG